MCNIFYQTQLPLVIRIRNRHETPRRLKTWTFGVHGLDSSFNLVTTNVWRVVYLDATPRPTGEYTYTRSSEQLFALILLLIRKH